MDDDVSRTGLAEVKYAVLPVAGGCIQTRSIVAHQGGQKDLSLGNTSFRLV
jgi:hypothetical protein